MTNFNKVILAGNLTRDPELSYTAGNTAICKFGMAINHKWRDRNSGENREDTCFVDCVAFGRGGETINQYMNKGRPLLVEGRLKYSQWEAQDGGKRSKLEVVVDNFQFLGGGGQGGGGGGGGGGQRRQAAPARASAGGPPDDDYGPPPSGDEVPF
ncbi:MAG: single-stranded DNA-binding protein [Phycisphaerales bacterium]|nr:single-stranded DNA-binding protein [Phycisphaerales bacterium]